MLAIWGARYRLEAEFRNIVTGHWLGGILSQCPPAQYPQIDKLIGTDGGSKPAELEKIDPKEAASNARAWGAWLRAGQRRAGKKKGG